MMDQSWFGALGGPAWMGGGFGMWFFLLLVWVVVWKGLALWRAARKNSPIWFVVLLVVNTLGVLEILYYFFFADMGKKRSPSHRDEETHHTGEAEK